MSKVSSGFLKEISFADKRVLRKILLYAEDNTRVVDCPFNHEKVILSYILSCIYWFFNHIDCKDPKELEKYIRNKIPYDFYYKDERVIVDIKVKEDEIKLYIKDLSDTSYLGTNSFIFSVDKIFFYNTEYNECGNKIKISLNSEEITDKEVIFKKEDGPIYEMLDKSNDNQKFVKNLSEIVDYFNETNSLTGMIGEYIGPDDFILEEESIDSLNKLKDEYVDRIVTVLKDIKPQKIGIKVDTNGWWIFNNDNLLALTLDCVRYIQFIEEKKREIMGENKDEK